MTLSIVSEERTLHLFWAGDLWS